MQVPFVEGVAEKIKPSLPRLYFLRFPSRRESKTRDDPLEKEVSVRPKFLACKME